MRKPPAMPAYVTVDEVVKRIIGTSRRSIEHWIARDVDGFARQCVVRRAGRVLVDVAALYEWLEEGKA
jgi:hypothetical protein